MPLSRTEFEALMNAPTEETPPASGGVAADDPGKTADDKSGLTSKLERLTEKSIGKLSEIIDLPLDKTDPHFGGVLRAQTAAANTTLTTQTRVDESALRQREIDRLPALLELVRQVQTRLPPQPPGHPIKEDEG
jgi:hypothetical protein